MTIPPDAHLWHAARTLHDLGALTAQWLEGTISYSPTHGDRPDQETLPLIPVLAAANRAGFVTHFSQPGLPLANGGGQRAAVGGFCDEPLARRIEAAALGTDLVVLTTPPGWHSPAYIPITLDCGEAFTWIGSTLDAENIDYGYAKDCPAALDALKAAWQVDVFDPVWGRQDVLWERLALVWQ